MTEATDEPTPRALCVSIAILLALIALPMSAVAQQRTLHGSDGRVISRSIIDSQGTITTYDASTGRAVTRETRGGTVYDAQTGRIVGKREDKR